MFVFNTVKIMAAIMKNISKLVIVELLASCYWSYDIWLWWRWKVLWTAGD